MSSGQSMSKTSIRRAENQEASEFTMEAHNLSNSNKIFCFVSIKIIPDHVRQKLHYVIFQPSNSCNASRSEPSKGLISSGNRKFGLTLFSSPLSPRNRITIQYPRTARDILMLQAGIPPIAWRCDKRSSCSLAYSIAGAAAANQPERHTARSSKVKFEGENPQQIARLASAGRYDRPFRQPCAPPGAGAMWEVQPS